MRASFGLGSRMSVVVLVLLGFAWSSAGVAQSARENVTVERLQEELAERDAIIIELLNRVEALENAVSSKDGAGDLEKRRVDSAAIDTAESPPAGDLEVDELQAERALERGLVEQGARLLAPGQIEVAPRFALAHDEGMFPTALMVGGGSAVGEVKRTFDAYQRGADVRFGMPLGLQLEIGVPYQSVNQRMETGIDGAIQSAMKQSGSGAGDVTLGLAKAFGSNDTDRARIIGRFTWLTGSGKERDGPVFLGGGNSGLNAQATAYWRRDPVVFLLSGGYTHYEEQDSLEPGDNFRLSMGLGLAISPDAALIFSFDQMRTSEFSSEGTDLPGTERRSSYLGLSAQTLLGQRFSLGVDADVGLTDDAADYRFGISLSSRFNLR